MQGPSTNIKSFKQVFLKNLLLSLCEAGASSFSNATSLHERKLTVMYSLDIAMAAARVASTGAKCPKAMLSSSSIVQRSRCIVRRCCRWTRSWGRSGRARGAGGVARNLVRSRTMALREVIPGFMDTTVDEATLLHEAIDYAVHLRAQVDVLHGLTEAMLRSSSIFSAMILPSQ